MQPAATSEDPGSDAARHAPPKTATLVPHGERLLVSPMLRAAGIRHGFTTRCGGVSAGRFASLNVGASWGDRGECVRANLERIAGDAGFDLAALCQLDQVHSDIVVPLDAPETRARAADGMATASPLVLGVRSADCVCILLGDGEGRVAAVHAGWRGTVAGIAVQAVAALQKLGARPAALRAALGPSIGPCCFEVQADVATPFAALLPEAVRTREGGRLFVDLWLTNRHLLEGAGVPPEQIAAAPPCTHCDAARFFSYRRDGAGIGQHLAFISGGSA